jgi:hypothetical protein
MLSQGLTEPAANIVVLDDQAAWIKAQAIIGNAEPDSQYNELISVAFWFGCECCCCAIMCRMPMRMQRAQFPDMTAVPLLLQASWRW